MNDIIPGVNKLTDKTLTKGSAKISLCFRRLVKFSEMQQTTQKSNNKTKRHSISYKTSVTSNFI